MSAIIWPDYVRTRAPRLEDAQPVTDLMNAEFEHFAVSLKYEAEATAAEWTTPGHHIHDNSIVLEMADGRIIAAADLWTATPPVRSTLSVQVHPDYYDTPLCGLLLAWGEDRARTLISQCKPHMQVSIVSGAAEANTHKRDALIAAGFQEVRRFYQMQITMDTPPPVYPLPQGYHYEPYHHPDELEAIVLVDRAAFRDHFGYVETDLAEEVEEVRHFFESQPSFDPAIFHNVVEDTSGQIAASIWNLNEMDGDASVAYIDNVAVLREHRGKGIAIAMLTHSLARFYAAGRHTVALHVDADNLTGALRLYQKAGMHPVLTTVRYEKVLREGIDPATRQLSAQ